MSADTRRQDVRFEMEPHPATGSRDTLGAWALDSDIVPTDRES